MIINDKVHILYSLYNTSTVHSARVRLHIALFDEATLHIRD